VWSAQKENGAVLESLNWDTLEIWLLLLLQLLLLLAPTKEEVNAFAHVHLSVCLSDSKITQNMCMDLDEMLRVDRCQDIDKLINFWARSGL